MIRPLMVSLSVASLLAGCLGPEGAQNAPSPPGAREATVDRAFGESRILARAPAPWFIEGVTIIGDLVFTGTASGLVGTAFPVFTSNEPSRIFVLNASTGALMETILVEGEDTRAPHAITGLDADGAGRLYAASDQLGVLRFERTPVGWRQEVYAALPDLRPCGPLTAPPCSPTPDDERGFANDLTWDEAGNLYVTDSFQATLWRIPPGASAAERVPEVWYQHASMDRMFGPNGIRIGPSGDRMFVAVCCPDSLGAGVVDRRTKVVTVPFPDPGTAAPADFAVFENGEGADGIAFSSSGELFVASNFGNKVLILAADGTVRRTIENADLAGEGEMDFPASLAFNDAARALVVINYAISDATPASDQRYVLEVYVNETGLPEARPVVP